MIYKARTAVLDLVRTFTTAYGKEDEGILTFDEVNTLRVAAYKLQKAEDSANPNVLDRLAKIEEERDPHQRFADDLHELIHGYHSDIYQWQRRGNQSPALLAMALLEDQLGPDGVGELIRKQFSPNSKYGEWWDCPQCDEWHAGFVGEDECRRCYGWGYINSNERPDYDEYEWSEKGRAALNRGESWTAEQGAEEQARLKAEEEAEEATA